MRLKSILTNIGESSNLSLAGEFQAELGTGADCGKGEGPILEQSQED